MIGKSFDCGDPPINDFLQRYARQSHESGAAKTFLAIDNADSKTILGFYSLYSSWGSGLRRHAGDGSPRSLPGTMCRGSVWRALLQTSAGRDTVSVASFLAATPRGAACALRLKSVALCSSSMQRTTVLPVGTQITALCL